jgi:hypothetical protein
VKPYSKANLWLTEGYGNATAGRNATSVNVPTVGLLPGTYRVYMFLENEGNVTSYNETTVQLVPPGSIAVTSVPPGAAIYLDGTDTGVVTNGTLTDIPAGVYNVTVTLAGYSPASSSVTVAAGQTATVHFDMVPVPGCINVTSAPAGAEIYLDGTATGVVTNGTLTNVPVGNHTVTVTLSGYNSASSQVTVVTNQTTDVHFALTRTSSAVVAAAAAAAAAVPPAPSRRQAPC